MINKYKTLFCTLKNIKYAKNQQEFSISQIEQIQKHILSLLENTSAKKVRSYFGELSSYDEPMLQGDELPIILVDFKGEKELSITTELSFNIYIVNISFSKNKTTREQEIYKLYTLLEEINQELFKSNSHVIKVHQTKKIFDAKTDRGYLTIFTKDISLQTTPKELEDAYSM